jgi:hypothetical protein
MDTISQFEQNYRRLLEDAQAGKISQEALAAALDALQFQDEQGCRWVMGTQNQTWYYHNGQSWQTGNPHRFQKVVLSEIPGGRQPKVSDFRRVGFALLSLIVLILLPLFVLPMAGAAPGNLPSLAPSPRPPLSDGGKDGGGGGGVTAPNYGTITDLRTNLPGAGVEVSINGRIVRTDTVGRYSITGLQAGNYTVNPELRGQGTCAQTPVSVYVDGINSITVDLGFYSGPPPTATPQPSPTVTLTPRPTATISPQASPTAMPPSGGVIEDRPVVIIGLGLLLVGWGWVLSKKGLVFKP